MFKLWLDTHVDFYEFIRKKFRIFCTSIIFTINYLKHIKMIKIQKNRSIIILYFSILNGTRDLKQKRAISAKIAIAFGYSKHYKLDL